VLKAPPIDSTIHGAHRLGGYPIVKIVQLMGRWQNQQRVAPAQSVPNPAAVANPSPAQSIPFLPPHFPVQFITITQSVRSRFLMADRPPLGTRVPVTWHRPHGQCRMWADLCVPITSTDLHTIRARV
jgi:hypothetical protein